MDKSFVALAWICFLAYLILWPVGLILNLMWYGEASNIQRATGVEPEGKGCLKLMLILIGIGVGIVVLLFVAGALLSPRP